MFQQHTFLCLTFALIDRLSQQQHSLLQRRVKN